MLRDAASYRRSYQDVSGHKAVATTDSGSLTLVSGKTGYTVYVQEVRVSIITDAARTITFKDTAGTPVQVEATDTSPGANTHYAWAFGAQGKPLTEAKDFVAALSAAGLAAHIEWDAYMKQTAVGFVSTATGLQFP